MGKTRLQGCFQEQVDASVPQNESTHLCEKIALQLLVPTISLSGGNCPKAEQHSVGSLCSLFGESSQSTIVIEFTYLDDKRQEKSIYKEN